MSGVKISVNKEGAEKKLSKKRGRPKKVVKKVSSKASIAKARVQSSSNKKSIEKKVSKPKKNGILSVLIAVVVTGVFVGGGIYTWQNRQGEKSVNNVRQDARQVRMDFEQRLAQLKNKLTGVETENQKLKDSTKELEERAKLLEGAKKDFSDPEIGISFEYPAIFGNVEVEMIEGMSGKKFKASFSKNDKLFFGGVDVDFIPKASNTEVNLLDSQGYYKKRNKYYFQTVGMTNSIDYEVVPNKEIEIGDSLILLVSSKSFVSDEEASKEDNNKKNIEMGDDIGAIVNLEIGNFRGLTFLNKDLSTMPLENFETLLSSIVISK